MSKLNLKIITPEQEIFNDEVDELGVEFLYRGWMRGDSGDLIEEELGFVHVDERT